MAGLLAVSSHAFQDRKLHYDVTYTYLGKIAECTVNFVETGSKYYLDIEGKTRYMAYLLSGGWREQHITQGNIQGPWLQPLRYNRQVFRSQFHANSVYLFDHQTKKVLKDRTKTETIIHHMQESGARNEPREQVKVTHSKTVLNYFPSHEISSFMMNLETILTHFGNRDTIRLVVLGGDKKTGRLHINKPKGAELQKAMELLGVESPERVISVSIDEKMLQGNSGMMYLKLTEEYIPQIGAIENVFLFGDVRATLRM